MVSLAFWRQAPGISATRLRRRPLPKATGRADGRLTAETERAIREFELDRGMVPRGRICAELVRQLGAAAPKTARR